MMHMYICKLWGFACSWLESRKHWSLTPGLATLLTIERKCWQATEARVIWSRHLSLICNLIEHFIVRVHFWCQVYFIFLFYPTKIAITCWILMTRLQFYYNSASVFVWIKTKMLSPLHSAVCRAFLQLLDPLSSHTPGISLLVIIGNIIPISSLHYFHIWKQFYERTERVFITHLSKGSVSPCSWGSGGLCLYFVTTILRSFIIAALNLMSWNQSDAWELWTLRDVCKHVTMIIRNCEGMHW